MYFWNIEIFNFDYTFDADCRSDGDCEYDKIHGPHRACKYD